MLVLKMKQDGEDEEDGEDEHARRRKATNDNSPAFQCRVKSANVPSPAGTTGNTVPKISISVQPSRWDLWPCASTPALKRRAIIGLSRWDVSPLIIPAGEKFEPAHVGLRTTVKAKRLQFDRNPPIRFHPFMPVKKKIITRTDLTLRYKVIRGIFADPSSKPAPEHPDFSKLSKESGSM